ncbi:MAG: hypothetical protein U9R39_00270 [Campylobacterota bacterium]|nr:hypothetical protein [Campylobacterota bacterium]
MNLKITNLSNFSKDAKRLYKKYKNLPADLKTLQIELLNNPKVGINLGSNCYKIRLENSSVPTGKSKGFRVIYYYLDKQNNIYLMAIYSKSELSNISDSKIVDILKENNL